MSTMELNKNEIASLKNFILDSKIPYEDVKIELLDRMATDIEVRMEHNPNLSFTNAIRLSAAGIKEDIIGIQKDIEQRVIKNSIAEAFGFRNIKSTVVFMVWTILTYACFRNLGTIGAPIATSILTLIFISMVVCRIRLHRIPYNDSLELKYRKKNFWVPLLLAAFIACSISLFFVDIINGTSFWGYIDDILMIPICVAYGFLLKVITHISVFWIDDIRTRTTLDKQILAMR